MSPKFSYPISKRIYIKKVKNNSFEYKEENKKSEIIQLVWYLYNKILTPNKIQESSISDFEKIIFTCAYYEQTNKINGVKFLKKQLKEENFTPKQFQRLKELLEHMKVNHKIFDMAFYNKILTGNSHIDFEGFTLPEEKEEKRIIPVEQVKIEKSAVSLKNKRDFFVPSQKQVQAVEPSVIPTKVKKIVKEKTHKPTQTLREKYYKEILRLEKIIYIAMQTRVLQEQQEAMKAWDILENISSQPSDNKEALEKLSRILKKCNF